MKFLPNSLALVTLGIGGWPSKCILQVVGPEATEAYGVDQLCAGLSVVVKMLFTSRSIPGMSTMLLKNGDFH